jgi:hypothetical protein
MGIYDHLDDDALAERLEAVREITLCQRVMAKTGDNVLTILTDAKSIVTDLRHYPANDVYDAEYHAQYYFHAHPQGTQPKGEVGHFHTFLRPFGMPAGMRPLAPPPNLADQDGNGALSHIVGIAVNEAGAPTRLFTTNRWVTGESWYAAQDVARMLESFVIDHARPSWPVNRWLTALVHLYREEIIDLLAARDVAMRHFQQENAGSDCYEDRALEVLSERAINLVAKVSEMEQEASSRRRSRRRVG